MKPYGDVWKKKRWWSKIEVYPLERDVRLYTRKVDYGPFNLQLVADHQIGTTRAGIHWKLGTNIFNSGGEYGGKQKLRRQIYDDGYRLRADVSMNWNAEISMPNMEGGITGSGGQVDIVTGQCQVEVPAIAGKVRFLDRPSKEEKTTEKKRGERRRRKDQGKAAVGANYHVVQDGEWLSKIAGLHPGVTVEGIKRANAKVLGEDDLIFPGQRLVLPAPSPP